MWVVLAAVLALAFAGPFDAAAVPQIDEVPGAAVHADCAGDAPVGNGVVASGASRCAAVVDQEPAAPHDMPWELLVLAMAAPLTRDRSTIKRGDQVVPYLVGGGQKIFAGALTVLNGGYAEPGSVAVGLIAVGRANESVDNSDGQDGDAAVLVERGIFRWDNDDADPVTQAEVGAECYIVDDHTVSASSDTGARSIAGIVRGIEPGGVWVETR